MMQILDKNRPIGSEHPTTANLNQVHQMSFIAKILFLTSTEI